MSVVHSLSASNTLIEEEFLTFFQSNSSGSEKLSSIQKDDFGGENFVFHYEYQESYRTVIQDSHYPRYTPIGQISVVEISSQANHSILNAQWLISDNPTPGINTNFCMSFIVSKKAKKENAESIKKNASKNVSEEINFFPKTTQSSNGFESNHDRESKSSKAVQFPVIQKLGYKEGNVDIQTFAKWFFKNRLGFGPENIGIDDKSGRPVTYNMEAFLLNHNLNVIEDRYVYTNNSMPHLPRPFGTLGWIEDIVSSFCETLQSSNPFHKVLKDSEVRQKLTISSGRICLNNEIADNVVNKIYAVNSKGAFYLQGVKCGHHPDLLKGKHAWCAGHISITGGVILFLSNDSGHYTPHPYHLYTFVEYLNGEGLFGKNAEIQVIDRYERNDIKTTSLGVEKFLKNYDKKTLELDWLSRVQKRLRTDKGIQLLFNCAI